MNVVLRLELLRYARQWRRVLGAALAASFMAGWFVLQAAADARVSFLAVTAGALLSPPGIPSDDYALLRGVGRTRLLLSIWTITFVLSCAFCALLAIYLDVLHGHLDVQDVEVTGLVLLGSLLRASIVPPMRVLAPATMLFLGFVVIFMAVAGKSSALADIYYALVVIPLCGIYTVVAWRHADFVNAPSATP